MTVAERTGRTTQVRHGNQARSLNDIRDPRTLSANAQKLRDRADAIERLRLYRTTA